MAGAETTNAYIQEQIRLGQPHNARFYALLKVGPNGTVRYPAAGALMIAPFQPPTGIPSGTYLIHYFVESNSERLPDPPAPKTPPCFTITWPTDQPPQIPMASGPELTLAAMGKNFREMALLNNDPAMRTAAIDYIKQEAAIKLQIETQRFLRDGRQTAELGEMQNYTMVVRQEYQEIMEFAALVQKRALEQQAALAENMTTFMNKSLGMWTEMLEKHSRPAQPVDYNPTLIELIKTARDIPIALIQARSGTLQTPQKSGEASVDTVKAGLVDESQKSAPAVLPTKTETNAGSLPANTESKSTPALSPHPAPTSQPGPTAIATNKAEASPAAATQDSSLTEAKSEASLTPREPTVQPDSVDSSKAEVTSEAPLTSQDSTQMPATIPAEQPAPSPTTGKSAADEAGTAGENPLGRESAPALPNPRRKQLCPCGSGKKYKKCHGRSTEAAVEESGSAPPQMPSAAELEAALQGVLAKLSTTAPVTVRPVEPIAPVNGPAVIVDPNDPKLTEQANKRLDSLGDEAVLKLLGSTKL